uniref:C2H2-type domain-containing protein n=1 Tax=Timema bartmani TaxID=61472 RepID=A0A7R9I631_9NEOP|nr:unnamed protein product [Timema bartmani]
MGRLRFESRSDSSSVSTSPIASPVLTTDVLFPVTLCEIVYKREQAALHSDRSREDKDMNGSESRPKTKHKQQRYHTRKKRYLCSYCNLTFNRKETRNRHVFVHTGEKPHGCSDCGAKFVQRGHLKRHALIHRHEKPHACPDCSARFRDKRNLNTHMLQHTGEKPFGCLLCDSRFSDRSNLRRHEAIHTGKRPYPCTLCNAVFARKVDIVHMSSALEVASPILYRHIIEGAEVATDDEVWLEVGENVVFPKVDDADF